MGRWLREGGRFNCDHHLLALRKRTRVVDNGDREAIVSFFRAIGRAAVQS
jgi:hypothetical protein